MFFPVPWDLTCPSGLRFRNGLYHRWLCLIVSFFCTLNWTVINFSGLTWRPSKLALSSSFTVSPTALGLTPRSTYCLHPDTTCSPPQLSTLHKLQLSIRQLIVHCFSFHYLPDPLDGRNGRGSDDRLYWDRPSTVYSAKFGINRPCSYPLT